MNLINIHKMGGTVITFYKLIMQLHP